MRILANVKSYSQLLIELQKVRDKALKATGEKTKELVKEQIQQEVYSIPEGEYERTGQLKDSMTNFPLESKGNVAEVKIAHDIDSMTYDTEKFQHGSNYWEPNDYRKYVAQTVHDGTSGSLFGVNKHWHEPKPYMDNAKKEMEDGKYKKFMEEEINAMGIKTK